VTSAAPARAVARSVPTWLDRVIAAYPLVLAYVGLLMLTAWQTTRHVTPWNFTDELKWAELSRSIADVGRPELRGQPAHSDSLYSYFLAPAWLFHDTDTAYSAAKYLNAAVMTATIFPAYGLSRLFARRWTSLAAAICAGAIPAVSYSSMLIPEPLAYFWSTLAVWLVARALLRPARWTLLAATASLAIAPYVRSELAVLVPTAAVAAGVLAVTSTRSRAILRGWSAWDWIGATILLLGAAIWVNAFLAHHSYSWQIGTHFPHRMLEYGLWAAGAFTIALGVVPAVIAFAWGLSAWTDTREDRALLGLLFGGMVGFGLYTAVKASYISTVFAIRVEERNLIYLAPIVLGVTARWLDRGRVRLLAVAAAAVAAWYLVHTTPYHMEEHFSVDAPGLAVLSWLNRTWSWTPSDAERLLLGMTAFAAALLVARELLERRRGSLGRWQLPAVALLALVLAAVVAWNVTGQITAANASNAFSRDFRGPLPKPPDFIDRTTGGEPALFIGQQLGNSNALWSLEFWNRSIGEVWSVDASAPGPGPARTPNITAVDGTVAPQIPVRWAAAGGGIEMVGKRVATKNGIDVVKLAPPIRIRRAAYGVTPDGWMGSRSIFVQYSSPGHLAGNAVVSVSRSAACGDVPPARLTIRLARVRINQYDQPSAGRRLATRHLTVRSTPCQTTVVRIPARPPFVVETTADRTFQPSQFDRRDLSVTIGYRFEPARQ
jgi:hypothetical protein